MIIDKRIKFVYWICCSHAPEEALPDKTSLALCSEWGNCSLAREPSSSCLLYDRPIAESFQPRVWVTRENVQTENKWSLTCSFSLAAVWISVQEIPLPQIGQYNEVHLKYNIHIDNMVKIYNSVWEMQIFDGNCCQTHNTRRGISVIPKEEFFYPLCKSQLTHWVKIFVSISIL